MRPEKDIDKLRLLKSLNAQRVLLETILENLSEADMLIPGVAGSQTVKDLVAHISAWDQRGTAWIEQAGRGEMPRMPEPGKTWADLDAINAAIYAANRDRPLGAVLDEFAATWPSLLNAAQAMPDQMLRQEITFHNGQEQQTMFAGRLIAWRYRHYREHGLQIQRWRESLVSGGPHSA